MAAVRSMRATGTRGRSTGGAFILWRQVNGGQAAGLRGNPSGFILLDLLRSKVVSLSLLGQQMWPTTSAMQLQHAAMRKR